MGFVIFLLLLLLSALFSSSETAFLSIGKIRVKRLESIGTPGSKRVLRLLKDPHKLLITILVGNTLVNIAASSVMADTLYGFFGEAGVGVSIVVMTGILLIAGEVTPKMFALKNAVNLAFFASVPLAFFEKIFFPVSWILERVSRFIVRGMGIKIITERQKVTDAEIKSLFSMGQKRGVVKEKEINMVENVLSFKSSDAADIMTPRIDLVALDLGGTRGEIEREIKEDKFSRYPVYAHTIDNIVGIIHAKDVLLSDSEHIREFVRKPLFAPESMKIDDLLHELRSKHKHMAIITDEYGVTSGIVTIEDILEEIVGEIRDELDEERPKIKMLDQKTYEVNGQAHLDEVNDELGMGIDTEDVDTIGGYVILELGKIPAAGDVLEINGFRIKVMDVSKNRVTMLEVTKTQ
jgi:putative hemolysin